MPLGFRRGYIVPFFTPSSSLFHFLVSNQIYSILVLCTLSLLVLVPFVVLFIMRWVMIECSPVLGPTLVNEADLPWPSQGLRYHEKDKQ